MLTWSKIYCGPSLLTFKKINLLKNCYICFPWFIGSLKIGCLPAFQLYQLPPSCLLYVTDMLIFSENSKSLLCLNSHIFSFTWQHLPHSCLAQFPLIPQWDASKGTSQLPFLNAQAMYLLCILRSLPTFPVVTSETFVIVQCLLHWFFLSTIFCYTALWS